MEPSSTSVFARVLGAIKEWPLWLLVALALSLTVLVAVPAFRDLASPATGTALVFAAIVSWIFVVARAARPITEALINYLNYRKQQRCFFVTPIDHQCHWGVSKQQDGSYVTQLAVNGVVKNRSAEPLYLMKARLIKPKIKGEVLPGLVLTKGRDGSTYGTAHVSGNCIDAGHTLPVTCTILIRGRPKQQAGPMRATIEIADADGHRERIKVLLAQVGPIAS